MIGITNWMADFMGALIFTTLTGSVALMIWDAFGCRLEEYGYFRWYYAGWKLVILLFLVPVVYVAGVCFPRFRYWFGISVPAVAAGSWRVLAVCGIWGLGVLVMCFYFGRQALWLHGRNRGIFPVRNGSGRCLRILVWSLGSRQEGSGYGKIIRWIRRNVWDCSAAG